MHQTDQTLAMWRTAARTANAVANSLLSGTGRMLQRQAEISRELLAEYADTAKQIESVADMPGLLSIQSRLARIQVEKATRGWTEYCIEAGMTQKELLRTSQAFVLDFSETMTRALGGLVPAPGAEPVMTAMKLVVDATRSSYAATAESNTEQATVSQPRPSTGGNRQAAG